MRAKIWKFFRVVTIEGETKRQCLTCRSHLPVPKDQSTSHKINHLKTKGHEEQYKQYAFDTPMQIIYSLAKSSTYFVKKMSGQGYDAEGNLKGAAKQQHEAKMEREGRSGGVGGGDYDEGQEGIPKGKDPRGFTKKGELKGAAKQQHEAKMEREGQSVD